MASDHSVASMTFKDTGQLLDGAAFRHVLRRATFSLLIGLMIPLVVALGLVEYMRRSSHWVVHTERVISGVNHVEKLLVTMQSGFRGYRLLKDPTILVTYHAARNEFEPQLRVLADLIADNPRQQERLDQFAREARTWIDRAETSLRRIESGEVPETEVDYLRASRDVINDALASAESLIVEDERLLVTRRTTLDRVVSGLLVFFGVAALIGIPAMIIWLQGLLRKVSRSYRDSLDRATLRANELQVTLNSIGDAVVVTDAQGRVAFINPVAEGMMGWSNAEVRGRPLEEVFQIFDEVTGAVAVDPVGRVLRENVMVGLANHTVLRSRKGREYPIEDSAAPIRAENGKILGVILVFHDVGVKRETERQLEQSERRLGFLDDLNEATRMLIDPAEIMRASTRLLGSHLHASRCAYAEVSVEDDRFSILEDYTDGCISSAGNYGLEMFGPKLASEMRAGRTLVLRDIGRDLTEEGGVALFRAIEINAIVCRPLMKQGRLRAMMAVHQKIPRIWTMAEIRLIEDVAERCWATIERARAEAGVREAKLQAEAAARDLAESADRFRLIAGVVSLQVWTAKLNGELDYANQECAQYFGVVVDEEVLGNAWTRFVHPEDLPKALDIWLDCISSGRTYEVEFRLRNRQGNYRWFLSRAVATRDSRGQIAKWFGTNTDIDDMKRAQSEAERASRAKDDFIAALSHELRTPLTPVLLIAATLKDDLRLPPEVREQMSMMERNISLEARLIDDLLDLTSITRGKFHLRAAQVDAHSLIGLAVEIVRQDAYAKEITIERSFKAHRSGLFADPSRFQQVIWNLLRNAVKFTPSGGTVTISTAERVGADGKPWLRIVVTDSGIGIQQEMLEKIFRPFEQGDFTGDHRFGGVGLGLAIARAVVNLHGGLITAQSEGQNLGSTFVAEFPGATLPPQGVVDPAQLSLPHMSSGTIPPIPLPANPARNSLRLLLIEDHEATLQVLLRLLTREGHRVLTARTVGEALQLATGNAFDLVVSDLGLPDGTGTELMQKLREAYGLRGIALSGYGMEDDLIRSRDAGFIAHLIKPVDFQQLKQALDTLSSSGD